jgi:DNA-binding MarR family transcriptional regulator
VIALARRSSYVNRAGGRNPGGSRSFSIRLEYSTPGPTAPAGSPCDPSGTAVARHFAATHARPCRQTGLTPALHQLLLVVRGSLDPEGPTIGEAAEQLQIRHHSTVELAQRAETAGLLGRERDPIDRRRVRLRLTEAGAEPLDGLTIEHLPRIEALAGASGRSCCRSSREVGAVQISACRRCAPAAG